MTSPITIFYVYAETDEALRQKVDLHLALLKRQGVLTSWQESLAGALWEQERAQVFDEASLILLLVSADFQASDVCYKEQMLQALERERQGKVKVIPILLRPVDWKSAPFAHLRVLPSNEKPITSWLNQDVAFAQVTEEIRRVLAGKLVGQERMRMVRNRFFMSLAMCVILGGIGWATMTVTTMDLPEKREKEQEVIVEAVKQWLQKHQGWLLILDNADEPEVLEPFLPPVVGGHILVTTRASDLTMLGLGFGHGLEIETFTVEQGALFVLHRAGLLALNDTLDQARGEDRQRAMDLSEEQGGLPLALDQAGAYIAQTRCTPESYRQQYQAHRRQLLLERRGREHPDPVAPTWKLSFERVEAKNPEAAELLRWCSFLAPDAIGEWIALQILARRRAKWHPRTWGYRLLEVWRREGRHQEGDECELDGAVEALQGYSLLKCDAQTGMFSIYRLVQVVLRDVMAEEEETAWKKRMLLLLQAICPDVSKFEQWPKYEQWVPHALVSATGLEQAAVQTEAAAFWERSAR